MARASVISYYTCLYTPCEQLVTQAEKQNLDQELCALRFPVSERITLDCVLPPECCALLMAASVQLFP